MWVPLSEAGRAVQEGPPAPTKTRRLASGGRSARRTAMRKWDVKQPTLTAERSSSLTSPASPTSSKLISLARCHLLAEGNLQEGGGAEEGPGRVLDLALRPWGSRRVSN